MTTTIRAVFENGVFRPLDKVDLPEHSRVAFEPRLEDKTTDSGQTPPTMSPGLAEVYAILGERYASGHPDTAERHNEHQP